MKAAESPRSPISHYASAEAILSRPKVLSHEWTKVTIANYPTLN